MGRHSRGSGEAPAPLPDPPARHPYAPRPAEDTGNWDRSTYRVVDVGLPEGPPGPERSGLPPVPERATGPSRFGPGGSEPPRYGATRADLAAPPTSTFRPRHAPPDPRSVAPTEPRFGATRADLAAPRPGSADPRRESRFGGLAEPRREATRADPAGSRFGGLAEPRRGATAGDLAEPGFGAAAERGFGATAGGRAEPRFGGLDESRFGADPVARPEPRFGATRADLAESRFGAPVESRSGAPTESRFGAPVESRSGVGERLDAPVEARFGGGRGDLAEPRFGATRADLYRAPDDSEDAPATRRYGAQSMGSTALAPRPAPDPDEVTDTGARRARSAFRLAETATDTDDIDDTAEDHDDHEREPSLLLQWGIFVAQTLTGAVAGLGVWLGFYRLWSTWPFYAVPAVGVAAIAMLVLARTLRRRHGRDLDLLTAAVTVGVSTVLTVLPAAFTLQNLPQ